MNSAVDAWAVTPRERLKYQEQFRALQPQAGFVTGAQAKGFFLQSQLPPLILGQIWALADTDSDGKMNINEFSIACKLINLKLRGMDVPKVLPPSLLSSLTGDVPSMTPRGSTSSLSPLDPLKGIVPAVAPVVPVVAPPVAVATVISPPGVSVPSGPTPPTSNPPSRHTSISERAPSIESVNQGEWAVQAAQKRKYTQVFNANDRTRSGYLTGSQARGVLVQSKLPQVTLAQIWTLSDIDGDGRLNCDEFILAMFLCEKAMAGEKIPVTLPQEWVPPNLRKIKSRPGSVSGVVSRPGSQPASRHASVSSQSGVGVVDADPTAGLPGQNKRKENYVKGQAELDRRRKIMEDQQRKEREERERKEREEADKREKARLEAERKQQEELERQLQRQREIEMEKEEQRKRELEAKEAARKELEKQRQQEWEQARIAEMNAQKEREQERVLKQKAHNTQLNVELSTLNEKIKELSQRICDTRAGVTNVKTVIDGMRTQRDTSMSEMSQLKARIKEQNAKLLQLTQERAKWEAKSKASGAALGGENAQQEQLNAAFAHKQLIINQIKDKVENISKEIESKKEDINTNDVQMSELKAELSALITKCEDLYKEYDVQRTSVLELKYNRKNETSVSSAWDTGSSSAWEETGTTVTDPYAVASNDISALAAPAVDLGGPAPEGFVKYQAVYEFNARNAEEITFVPGDIILVPLEQNAEPGWLAGEINGHTGWFPESYVEKLEVGEVAPVAAVEAPVDAQVATVADTYNDNINTSSIPAASADLTAAGDVEYYIAAYPYESAEEGDLSFSAGEMVMVIKKEGEWWTGTIGSRTGMFPSNYVQKADVGTASTAAAEPVESLDQETTLNGNAAYTAAPVEAQEQVYQPLPVQEPSEQPISSPGVGAEEAHEDLDTEVSQINTQSKTQSSEPAESYSRPMSRTSSMTPGMRAKRSEIAQVIAPYEATSTEQLSLTRGQLIMIRKKTDSGWWEGELQAKGRRRQIGWFPATYVKVLQGGRNSGRNTPVSGSRIEMTEQILDKVIALYPYKAQNDDELSFDKDDIISVLGRDEPEWWRGELNGLSGLFPSNYVGPFVTSEIKPDPGACSRRSKGIQRLWQQWRGCDIDQAAQHGDASNNKLRGIIQAVHITKRRDGQLMGCAYVRFECNELLAKSMLQENGNQLVGKAVVVDWQPELPKKRFRQWRCW
uniref:Dynamin associated protein 160, isoform D n=1 Tax=Drosophila melanogaster TaxID=7227 RepID=M9ND00_DROME|nr:dynamin associated protein 160, isoform D [Drosophila melanogaster]AFH03792.1 dynamin associated protein 160, isoform D [Drosophila melanogaster]|eukprot:NP_001246118.1 dynamin associated protein 160, isoform D [Drosophila melanogaster]